MNPHHTTSNLLFVQFDISITSRLVSHDYRLSRSTQQMELIFKRAIVKFMFLFTACKNQFESHDQVFLLMLRFFSVIIRYMFFSCFSFSSFFLQLLWMKLYIIIKKTGNRLQLRKKFSLYVWPIARYIYIKISISTSCSELTIIWYSFYLLTFEIVNLVWRFHLLFAINQLLKPVWTALALNKIGKLTKSAVYKPL